MTPSDFEEVRKLLWSIAGRHEKKNRKCSSPASCGACCLRQFRRTHAVKSVPACEYTFELLAELVKLVRVEIPDSITED